MTEYELLESLGNIADYVQDELKRLYTQLGEKSAYHDTYPDGMWEREVWEIQAKIDALEDLHYQFDLRKFESVPFTAYTAEYRFTYSQTMKTLKSREEPQ